MAIPYLVTVTIVILFHLLFIIIIPIVITLIPIGILCKQVLN